MNAPVSLNKVFFGGYVKVTEPNDWEKIFDLLEQYERITTTQKVCLKAILTEKTNDSTKKTLCLSLQSMEFFHRNALNTNVLILSYADLKMILESDAQSKSTSSNMALSLTNKTFEKLRNWTLCSPVQLSDWDAILISALTLGLLSKNNFDELIKYKNNNAKILSKYNHYLTLGTSAFNFSTSDITHSLSDFTSCIISDLTRTVQKNNEDTLDELINDSCVEDIYETVKESFEEELPIEEDYSNASHMLVKILSASTPTKLESKMNEFFSLYGHKIRIVDIKPMGKTTITVLYTNNLSDDQY